MRNFIGHLSLRGLSSSTISSRYMAPARHWLKALAKQRPHVTGEARNRVDDYRASIEDAIAQPTPRAQSTSTRSALYRHGTRLTTTQINDLFALLATVGDELTKWRDIALIYVGITSALRVAELSRITLNSITQAEGCYEIKVRGKRNQVDPVAVDPTAIKLIQHWVSLWNAAIDDPTDLRHIGPNTPVWQPLRTNGTPYSADRYNPHMGMTRQSLAAIIKRRTRQALGISIAPHDLRRTYAARAKEAGIDLNAISAQLRHKSISTTQRYIGDPPNMAAGLLTNAVPIAITIPA
jgi:integrase